MKVKSIILICPSCGEFIVVKPDEIEFEVDEGDTLLTLECPDCGAFFEREKVENA